MHVHHAQVHIYVTLCAIEFCSWHKRIIIIVVRKFEHVHCH